MNKWWLASTAVLLLVACAADAKKKWKADEDFEFEEVHWQFKTFIVIVAVVCNTQSCR